MELMVEDIPGGKMYLYMSDLGNILQFTYTYDKSSSDLFVKTEDCEHHSDFVNTLPADIYIVQKENENSAIIWQDQRNGVLFEIYARMNQAELIALAETVTKIS